MSENKYNDSSIQVLEGLEAVRKRPGMYIGSTDEKGLHHLVWEIMDNAIDEVLGGFGDKVNVVIKKDGSISIEDFGRGIPVGKNEKTGLSTPEVIFTVLHAGGKFGGEDSGYKTSGGLHGVGSSVVNALSSWLEIEIVREGIVYELKFTDNGETSSGLKKTTRKTSKKSGTKVTFKPENTIFSTTKFDYKTIKVRLQESAFLLKNLEINLVDERKDLNETFKYEDGIVSYIDFLREDKKSFSQVFYFSETKDDIEVEIALQYVDNYTDKIYSFVNNVRTKDGGSHENGFKSGLTKAFNEYAKAIGLLKEKDKQLEGSDVREGIIAIIATKIPENLLQFEGQTKSKLGTNQARSIVDSIVSSQLPFVLNQNKKEAIDIIEKAKTAQKAREAARKTRESIRLGKKDSKKEVNLSGKLTPTQIKDPTKTELFIVEGDSAGGCVSKNEKVKLADNRVISIGELLKEHNEGKVNYVYGFDIDNKEKPVNAFKILDVFKTKENAQVIKLTFDDNTTCICTPDHPFLLRENIYKAAQDLTIDDSLRVIHFYHYGGKEYLYSGLNRENIHRSIAEKYKKNFSKELIVHHIDDEKTNNVPENLECMTNKEHTIFHNNINYGKGGKNYEKNNERLYKLQKEYWDKEENRQKTSERVTKYYEDNPEKKEELSEKAKKQWDNEEMIAWRSQKTIEQGIENQKTKTNNSLSLLVDMKVNNIEFNRHTYEEERIKKMNGSKKVKDAIYPYYTLLNKFNKSLEELIEARDSFNHRVVKIEWLEEKEDVYDITVDEVHNFCLANGVVVHNSAKQARDRRYQAILPLRGKVINSEKESWAKIFKNEEIYTIIHTIGAGIGEDFDLSKSKYSKVVIMTDADTDGAHIQILLLTFFYQFMRPLVDDGRIFLALPPLYKVYNGVGKNEKFEYAYNDEELKAAQEKMGPKSKIQRYKGLGEMNADQLEETTMAIGTRKLVKVKAENVTEAEKILKILMGKDIPPRKAWIDKNIDFSVKDVLMTDED